MLLYNLIHLFVKLGNSFNKCFLFFVESLDIILVNHNFLLIVLYLSVFDWKNLLYLLRGIWLFLEFFFIVLGLQLDWNDFFVFGFNILFLEFYLFQSFFHLFLILINWLVDLIANISFQLNRIWNFKDSRKRQELFYRLMTRRGNSFFFF